MENDMYETAKPALEILDNMLEGIFVANDLRKPVTLTKCFNEETARDLTNYLDKLLKASHTDGVRDFLKFIKILFASRHTLP